MSTFYRIILFTSAFIFCILSTLYSQTSWKGTASTAWNTASNWTAGVPTAATDAILGDANFSGVNQPTVNATASCKSLTVGGAKATTLTLTRNLVVSGNVINNSNGSISHPASTLTLSGNWVNNGTYTTTSGSARVIFGGVAQSISGSSVTTFRRITVNASSTVSLAANIIATGTNSYIYVYGILNPSESPGYTVTSTVQFRVFNNGRIKVNAATFAGNYILSGTQTFSSGCIVEYSSTTINQTISSSYTYSTLIVSGTGVKSLAGNLPSLNSSTSLRGNIYVNSATLDLLTFTANRNTSIAGGTFIVANGALLRIGGTNTFPANYNTRTLNLNSTVEYSGTNQTVLAEIYGNLILSSSSGAATKAMPGTAFTIEGNFTSTIGAGASVSYTSASNVTFNGNVAIGSSTTFNGSGNSHIIRGSWSNSGTFTGATGTVTFDGAGGVISGGGTQNFNNLSFTSTGITATAASINVSGNLSSSGAGQFTHGAGGLITMTGAAKTLTGVDIILNDFTLSGSVTTNTSFTVNGNMAVPGSFTASAGAVTMTGTSKTISGAGTITYSTLSLTGSITTASGFFVSSLLDVTGSFTATAGTATFISSSVLSGTANLYNVTINGTSLQLSSGSVLGIASIFSITAGAFNVTAATPNTVNFNGIGAQNVNAITYHHLTLSNGNTKTAAGGITVNSNLTISASTTFNGGLYTHTVLRNWINNGAYSASAGTVQFTGTSNATVTGATVFNILNINKSAATTSLSLLNNISASTVNMTTGTILTGSNTLTITTTRTGNGIILGTITRTHLFAVAVPYAFEGPDNTITFSSVLGVGSVTVKVTVGSIGDFPGGSSINREYTVSVPAGTYNVTLRLHYEDAELNGTNESAMVLWNYAAGTWTAYGKTGNNATSNYVEQSGLTNISYRWTCDESAGVARWNGSANSDWNTAANWTTVSGGPAIPPSANDVVQIGTGAFTNQPTITNVVTVKSISFGSVQAATLTLGAGGSLTTSGNISGSWAADATHVINAGSQNLTVNGSLILSNGTGNRSINLNIGSGTVSLSGSLIQTGNAAVTFSGTGALNIGTDFNYTSGAFTAGSGTVVYNGTGAQNVASVSYNNLTVNKPAGIASLGSNTILSGNLLISSGYFDVNASSVTIAGDLIINTGTTLDCDGVTINAAGNWTNSGTYVSTTGTAIINGTGAQTISAGNFNNLTINKVSGTALLTGNNSIKGNIALQAGTLDLATFTANRTAAGGSITISGGTVLLVGGANNFPSGYTSQTINAASLVHYNGSGTQSAAGVTYGNLIFSNGGANAKTLLANATVASDITINSGATFHSGGYTVALSGNWTNTGTFVPSSGTLVLNGSSKTITGNTIFNRVTVNGSYSVPGNNIVYNGHLQVTVTGSYSAGSGTATVNGDLTNSGSLISTGTTTFTGTSLQTLRLINALASSSTGVVNFNGTVAPVMNSTSSPQFATLNINNSAGVNPSVGWSVFVAMNVSSGASFNGGISVHNIYGSFANSGIVTSTGTMNFIPLSAQAINLGSSGFSSSGNVNFGGAGQITLTGTPTALNNVLISNTNSAGVSPPSGWNIDSSFSIASNAIFNAGSYTYTVGGDIQSDGTLNGGSSTFIMNSSAGDLTASSTTEFYHFTVAGTITPLTDFRVAGNFTNDGTYDGSVGVLIMTGGNAAAISGTTVPSPVDQLTIEKTGSAIVTLNVNVSDVSFLNIFSGILFTSGKTITQNAGGGILIINSDATLRLGGTNSLPGFSGYGLDYNSNVDYAGTGTQVVGNAAEYGNLLFTTAPTKNAFVPFAAHGNLIISAGTLATSTVTLSHSIEGNFIMTGGVITGTSSTYILKGDIDQTLALLSNLVNLTVNKPSGLVVLGSDVIVNKITNLTSGKVKLGGYNYTVGTSGSISNYNASKYFIATGNGSLVQQVTNGGGKIFPVGFDNDYLPATIALTAGSATDNFSIKLLTEAYKNGDNGGVVTTNSVRATWLISETVPGGSDASVTLQWPWSLEQSGFNRILSRLAHYSSAAWDYGTTDIPASGSDPYFVTRSGFTSFSPFAISMFDALPVTWLSISGNNENGNNYIYWSTATEQNNDHFAIERSPNGIDFSLIGQIQSVGNSFSVQKYSFTHFNVASPVMYYRIKQVDIDGRYSYSRIIKINAGKTLINNVSIAPNPVINIANIQVVSVSASVLSLYVLDMSGKKVYSKFINVQKGVNNIDINMSEFSDGMYILKTNDLNNQITTNTFIKK